MRTEQLSEFEVAVLRWIAAGAPPPSETDAKLEKIEVLPERVLLAPGDRRDYRRWERDLLCRGWGPEAMEPWLAGAARRITGGEISPGPLTVAFAEAAADDGQGCGGARTR